MTPELISAALLRRLAAALPAAGRAGAAAGDLAGLPREAALTRALLMQAQIRRVMAVELGRALAGGGR